MSLPILLVGFSTFIAFGVVLAGLLIIEARDEAKSRKSR
jgi:hypothetical protein